MVVFGILLFAVSGYLVITTLLSFLRSEVWWIRALEFPRLQSFWMQVVCGVLYVIFCSQNTIADFFFLATLVACAGLQGYMIIPYTFLVKKQVLDSKSNDDPRRLTMLISNVLMTNRDPEKLLWQVRECDPDIVFCVETDKWWVDQLNLLKKDYPFHIEVPLDNTYGLAFYSRLKLIDPEVKYLVQDDVPSVHTQVELETGERIRLYGIHPRPPAPDESKTSLPRDAELVMVGKEAKKHGAPCIVAGDMNDVGWSRTTRLFQKLSGLLDPRIGRGMYCTFNANNILFRWSLDHVFISRHLRLSSLRRLPHMGSDHFPLCFTLSFEPEREQEHEKPEEADAADQRHADNKMRKAGVKARA